LKKFATQWHAHHTLIMSLHYLVKHKYPKINNIYIWAKSLVVVFKSI